MNSKCTHYSRGGHKSPDLSNVLTLLGGEEISRQLLPHNSFDAIYSDLMRKPLSAFSFRALRYADHIDLLGLICLGHGRRERVKRDA